MTAEGSLSRLYTLVTQGDPHGYAGYYTGQVDDGRQLLLGWTGDGMVALWFDLAGRLLGTEALTPSEAEVAAAGGTSKDASLRMLPGWFARVGYRPDPIRVLHFRVWAEDFPIYLKGLPEGLDGTWGTYSHAPERVAETEEAIAEWRGQDNFVLVWGDESFCLNADGSPWD